MDLTIENVTFGNGEFSGYMATPAHAAKPLPSVIVLQEAWGVDEHIEDVTRRFATAGYAALALDLFSKNGARQGAFTRERLLELRKFVDKNGAAMFSDEGKRKAALEAIPNGGGARVGETLGALFGTLGNHGAYLPALLASAKFLREEHCVSRGGKVGAVGYCLGGGLAGLLAAHDPKLGVACIYYGSAPSNELVPKIVCPVFGFYGSKDTRLVDGLPAFTEAMKGAGKALETHVYEGAEHAFFNDERPSYDVTASRDAFARTLEVFRRYLA